MLIDPDGKRGIPSYARYANINHYNRRPPSAGTIRHTRYNPVSRSNKVHTSYFAPSGSDGGSTYTDPQMTRGNRKAQNTNARVLGLDELSKYLKSVSKIERKTSKETFTDYRFEFLSKDAENKFMLEQFEYDSQYNQRVAQLKAPLNPGADATSSEFKEYMDNLTVYGMQKILIKMDMGDSPREELIKKFEVKSESVKQIPIIYEKQ